MANIVSTGKTISTSEYLERRNREKRRRRLIYLGILFAVLVAGVGASRLEQFRIQEIRVVGANVIPKDDVAKVAREFMDEKYFWLVPKDNTLLYPEEAIEQILFRKFPRFNSVALSVLGFETLEIAVTERQPYALYCVKEMSPCYFMDESGFIFDYAPTFSEGVYLIYSDEAPQAEPVGTQFLPTEDFKLLVSLVSHLPSLGLAPVSVEKGKDSFALLAKNGVRVLWSREHDIARVASNLESFLKSPEISGQKNFLERVAELDLRTEDKVFYRFRQ